MIVLDILKRYRVPAVNVSTSVDSMISIKFFTDFVTNLPQIASILFLENKPTEFTQLTLDGYISTSLPTGPSAGIGTLTANGVLYRVQTCIPIGLILYYYCNMSSLAESSRPLVTWSLILPDSVRSVIVHYVGPANTGLPFQAGDDLVQNPNVRAV